MVSSSLELLIDAQGVVFGGNQTRSELDRIIQKGDQAASSMGKVSQTFTTTGASMREAFGASKGALQVTQGLQSVTDGFVAAATGAGSFTSVANSAARVLLEVSKGREEWRNLSTSMRTVTTVSQEVERDMFGVATGMRDVTSTTRTAQTGFGALWGVLKANPITSIAAALGIAATAMNLFGKSAADAADGYAKLNATLTETSSQLEVAKLFGDPSLAAGGGKRNISALFQKATAARSSGSSVSVSDFVSGLGPDVDVGASDIWDALADMGDPRALELRRMSSSAKSNIGRIGARETMRASSVNYQISPEQQIELLRRQALSFGLPQQSSAGGPAFRTNSLLWYRPPEEAAAGGATGGYDGIGPYLPGTTGDALVRGGRIQYDREQQRQADEEKLRAMEQLEASAQRTGSYLADAATAFLTKTATAQQLLQQIVGDLIRSGLTQGFAAVSKGFLQSFGATKTQAAE